MEEIYKGSPGEKEQQWNVYAIKDNTKARTDVIKSKLVVMQMESGERRVGLVFRLCYDVLWRLFDLRF